MRDRSWRCDGIVRSLRAVQRGRDGAGAGASFGGRGEAVDAVMRIAEELRRRGAQPTSFAPPERLKRSSKV